VDASNHVFDIVAKLQERFAMNRSEQEAEFSHQRRIERHGLQQPLQRGFGEQSRESAVLRTGPRPVADIDTHVRQTADERVENDGRIHGSQNVHPNGLIALIEQLVAYIEPRDDESLTLEQRLSTLCAQRNKGTKFVYRHLFEATGAQEEL
jgi:hypothetical protein